MMAEERKKAAEERVYSLRSGRTKMLVSECVCRYVSPVGAVDVTESYLKES